MSQQILFTFFPDPLIGSSFSAWISDKSSDGAFKDRLKKLSSSTLRNYTTDCSSHELKILRLADELTHKELAKAFSKKPISLDKILSEKEPHFIKTYFRPHIDKRLVKIIELCTTNSIPVFFMNERQILGPGPLPLLPDDSLAQYHFKWSDEGLFYSLRISLGNQKLNLLHANTHIITDEPAYLIHDNRLIRMP
ncbi:MAG: hypothetical protein HOC82_20365, partial [Bacteroidetes bacterium]|nr:hypothetical protein [Bacteroidota bacterium]